MNDRTKKRLLFVLAGISLFSSRHGYTMSNENVHITAGPGMVLIHPYGAGFGFNAGLGKG